MKSVIRYLTLTAAVFIMTSTAIADPHHPPTAKPSPGLEKMKKLAGTWKGTGGDVGDGKIEIQYRLSAGGTTVIETLFPGSDHEMTSVYFDEDGKLAMTHYCMLGNHPTMRLKKETERELIFEVSENDPINKKPHMHSLDLKIVSPTAIEHTWRMSDPDKAGHAPTFKLNKVS